MVSVCSSRYKKVNSCRSNTPVSTPSPNARKFFFRESFPIAWCALRFALGIIVNSAFKRILTQKDDRYMFSWTTSNCYSKSKKCLFGHTFLERLRCDLRRYAVVVLIREHCVKLCNIKFPKSSCQFAKFLWHWRYYKCQRRSNVKNVQNQRFASNLLPTFP